MLVDLFRPKGGHWHAQRSYGLKFPIYRAKWDLTSVVTLAEKLQKPEQIFCELVIL